MQRHFDFEVEAHSGAAVRCNDFSVHAFGMGKANAKNLRYGVAPLQLRHAQLPCGRACAAVAPMPNAFTAAFAAFFTALVMPLPVIS